MFLEASCEGEQEKNGYQCSENPPCDLDKPRQPQLMLMSWQILLLIWQTASMSPVNLSTGKGK